MPRQVTGVQIADNGDGTASVTVDRLGYTVPMTSLFGPQPFGTDTISASLRLAYLLGGYKDPTTQEYLRGVNGVNGGLETPYSNVSIQRVQLVDQINEYYEVTFHVNGGQYVGQTFGIQTSLAELKQDTLDQTVVVANLAAFFRKGGYTSLTPAAIDAAAKWGFRY